MNKILSGILLCALCASCGGKKAAIDPFDSITHLVDSASRQGVDTLSSVQEKLQPLEADELFDDFIFNFASDKVLQEQRTVFPLPYNEAGAHKNITKKAWEHINLFPGQSYYTILFDREEDMELVGDTSLQKVQVEWLYLRKRMVKRYSFQKRVGMWMLCSIDYLPVGEKDGENDFISFYARFATDSVYQSQHICSPLKFITIDPDDEFSVLETTLDVNQWYAFRPMMPADSLSNFCYGQKNDVASDSKILKVSGIGNGYSNIFYFRKRQGRWELYKYEDTSI